MKNVKNTTQKQPETKAVAEVKVPEVLTIAAVFRKLSQEGAKDKKVLAEKIVKYLADRGVTRHKRGEIKVERVRQEISAIVRDINMERGKAKQTGWWYKYKVLDTDKGFKCIKTIA